ncbi:17102_t:CDS:2 [Acaulospora morrowiae]|uniref:17102_t:CDS:1 n=1 Tax=Acaulospora morrowiae TaxID=94023 RepID=A0A9N9CZ08_9GLOM|nr:17102_t:CDS:2 [Acaulospora morrowiae]
MRKFASVGKQYVKEGSPPDLYQASATERGKNAGVNYNEKVHLGE